MKTIFQDSCVIFNSFPPYLYIKVFILRNLKVAFHEFIVDFVYCIFMCIMELVSHSVKICFSLHKGFREACAPGVRGFCMYSAMVCISFHICLCAG